MSFDVIKLYAVQGLQRILNLIQAIPSVTQTLYVNNCVYICEALVRTLEKTDNGSLQKSTQDILKIFMHSNMIKSSIKAEIMHNFFNISQLSEERELLMDSLSKNAKYKSDWQSVTHDFLEQSSYSVESLNVLREQVNSTLLLLIDSMISFHL